MNCLERFLLEEGDRLHDRGFLDWLSVLNPVDLLPVCKQFETAY